MKANQRQVEQALDRADPAIRFYLLHGPDESASRALAKRIAKALGADAEKVELAGGTLKGDPALLADEAAAIALFGGPRYVVIDPAGDEILDAVDALLALPQAGNPVVAVAGALRKDSKLLKLATAADTAMAFASYVPEGRDADRVAVALGRDHGLQLRPDIARRLAAAAGNDRAVLEQEIIKFATFLDAAPDRPRELDDDALDALGADAEEGDLSRLVDTTLAGDMAAADAELSRLLGIGTDAIPIVRAFQRQLLLLAQLRAEVAEGQSIDAVMAGPAGRAVFWKEKDKVARLLSRWSPEGLATALARMAEAGRQAMRSGGAGGIAVEAEILALARAAQRMR
ncbi:DNA polymerase III, delta subunit [Sphingomonas laterariae]|uniref:DNA-directed DNA polymerase n=1 Tax=Edaphosphingomonas laterariae TaxID=861865 RepID=A0A239GSY8_9SPHN|nr:DNA polymerase III subunit delta [Sphingomonas laterariae]SNS72250.1 DNA polymerase III, delta subunit [Sphingomonas laterariae]